MRLFTNWNKNILASMSDFQESGINFSFQSNWIVIKYDEHHAHKRVEKCIKPTKAVDFLGINNKLYFVEVKNYRGHTKDKKTIEVLKNNGNELMNRIAIKVRDTIATSIASARFSTNDERLFTQVNQLLLDDSKKLIIIACIEFDVSNDKERNARMGIWAQRLKQKLSWLKPAVISVNSVENITNILPDSHVSFI